MQCGSDGVYVYHEVLYIIEGSRPDSIGSGLDYISPGNPTLPELTCDRGRSLFGQSHLHEFHYSNYAL